MKSESKNIIKEKSYNFALKIIKLSKKLKESREYQLSDQLLRSGTSIGANVEEAIAGQSRKDFIAKMSISHKEARETNYWLRLLRDSQLVNLKDIEPLINESEELKKILFKIIQSSSNNNC